MGRLLLSYHDTGGVVVILGQGCVNTEQSPMEKVQSGDVIGRRVLSGQVLFNASTRPRTTCATPAHPLSRCIASMVPVSSWKSFGRQTWRI